MYFRYVKFQRYVVEIFSGRCCKINNVNFIDPNMMCAKACVAETEKVMILGEEEQIEVKPLQFFADLVEDEAVARDVLEKVKVFGRSGWTSIKSVHTRNLWENERVFRLKTMSATVILTGDQRLPVIRANRELVLRASEMRAGDAVLLLAPLGLKDHLKGEKLERSTIRQGIMGLEPAINYRGKLVGIETEDGSCCVNDVIFVQNA